MVSRKTVTLCSDLIFSSKIKGTADQLGVPCSVVGTVAAAKQAAADGCAHLIIDLANPVSAEEMQELRGLADEATAFGSHVDVERLEQARQAGCDHVLPRSQFSANLVQILTGGVGGG